MASAKKKFKGKTYMTAVLDRSGSMEGLVEETISGFNHWLKTTQEAANADTFLTLHLFDDQHEVVYHRVPIKHVAPLTKETYYTRGFTALRDAFGQEILRTDEGLTKGDRALILVITDGHENASKEFSQAKLRAMIEEREKQDNWTFQFIGADQDAIAVGAGMGMHANAINIARTPTSTRSSYDALAVNSSNYAASGSLRSASLSQADFDAANAQYEALQPTDVTEPKTPTSKKA